MYTQKLYSNCFFGIFYLSLRKKISYLVLVSPLHFVALNKNGNALHFRRILSHHENNTAPWWFLGAFEGIRKSNLQLELKKEQRRVIAIYKYHIFFIIIFYFIWLMLFIPWVIGWCSWIVCWNIYWWFNAQWKNNNVSIR
jgi:hypothetical protein